MPRLLTDRQSADLPTLAAAIEAGTADEVLEDAGAIYAWVQGHRLASEDRARARALTDGMTVDRVNAALAFLRETGQLLTVPDSPVMDSITAAVPKDLADFNLDELQTLARVFGIPGRSKMSAGELVEALSTRPELELAPAEPAPADAPAA